MTVLKFDWHVIGSTAAQSVPFRISRCGNGWAVSYSRFVLFAWPAPSRATGNHESVMNVWRLANSAFALPFVARVWYIRPFCGFLIQVHQGEL